MNTPFILLGFNCAQRQYYPVIGECVKQSLFPRSCGFGICKPFFSQCPMHRSIWIVLHLCLISWSCEQEVSLVSNILLSDCVLGPCLLVCLTNSSFSDSRLLNLALPSPSWHFLVLMISCCDCHSGLRLFALLNSLHCSTIYQCWAFATCFTVVLSSWYVWSPRRRRTPVISYMSSDHLPQLQFYTWFGSE